MGLPRSPSTVPSGGLINVSFPQIKKCRSRVPQRQPFHQEPLAHCIGKAFQRRIISSTSMHESCWFFVHQRFFFWRG